MKVIKITDAGDEITRYGFISHMENYLRQLLNNPLRANVGDYLMSHGIDGPGILPMLLHNPDASDENNAILIRTERIKTDPETGKDRFCVKYKMPRKDFDKKLRNLFINLFEDYRTDNPLLNEDGEGACCCDGGGVGTMDGVAGATNAESSGPFIQPMAKIIKRKINKIDENFESELDQSIGGYEKGRRARNFRFSPDSLLFNDKLCNVTNGHPFLVYIINNNIRITFGEGYNCTHRLITPNCSEEIFADIRQRYLDKALQTNDDIFYLAIRDLFDEDNKPFFSEVGNYVIVNRNAISLRLFGVHDYYSLPRSKQDVVLDQKRKEDKILEKLLESYHFCDGRYWVTGDIEHTDSKELTIFSESVEQPNDGIVFAFWNIVKGFNSHQGGNTKIDIIKAICEEKGFDFNKCYILSSNNNEIKHVSDSDSLFLSDEEDQTDLDLMRQQHLQGNSPRVQAYKSKLAISRNAEIEKQHPGKTLAQINYEKGPRECVKKAKTIVLSEEQISSLKKFMSEEAVMDTRIGDFGYDAPASICSKNDPTMKRHNGKGGSISVNHEGDLDEGKLKNAIAGLGIAAALAGAPSCTPYNAPDAPYYVNNESQYTSHGIRFADEKEKRLCDFYYEHQDEIDNSNPESAGFLFEKVYYQSKSCGNSLSLIIMVNEHDVHNGKESKTYDNGYYRRKLVYVLIKDHKKSSEESQYICDLIERLNNGYQEGDMIDLTNQEIMNFIM